MKGFMRKNFFICLVAKLCLYCAFIWCFGVGSACAMDGSPPSDLQAPSISIPETDVNFGEVTETEPVSHDFVVKNGGRETLHIKDVTPS